MHQSFIQLPNGKLVDPKEQRLLAPDPLYPNNNWFYLASQKDSLINFLFLTFFPSIETKVGFLSKFKR